MQAVNEASKCEAEARYHKAEFEAKAKKIVAELCEAKARDAVLTINY